LRTVADIAKFFAPTLGPLVHEELWIAALDVHHGIRGVRMISRGGLGGANVKPGDVLRAALEMAAVDIVMAHNHPSGHPAPAEDDIFLTHAVEEAGQMIGVPLVHHVIVMPAGRFASVFHV
jgi:DNA repair protein RadC